MTWLMSTPQGWRLVCVLSPIFVDFRFYFCGLFRTQLTFSAQANRGGPSR
jgi:hypothetical protein